VVAIIKTSAHFHVENERMENGHERREDNKLHSQPSKESEECHKLPVGPGHRPGRQ